MNVLQILPYPIWSNRCDIVGVPFLVWSNTHKNNKQKSLYSKLGHMLKFFLARRCFKEAFGWGLLKALPFFISPMVTHWLPAYLQTTLPHFHPLNFSPFPEVHKLKQQSERKHTSGWALRSMPYAADVPGWAFPPQARIMLTLQCSEGRWGSKRCLSEFLNNLQCKSQKSILLWNNNLNKCEKHIINRRVQVMQLLHLFIEKMSIVYNDEHTVS